MNKDIPVVLLCGGAGTRLSEETVSKPKPMVEIGNRPILWHIMKHYAQYGFRKFVLALGYKAEYIKNYFYNYRISSCDFTLKMDPKFSPEIHEVNQDSDWEITFADTGVETLKGGRVKRLEKYIDSDYFLMTYGDAVCDVDLNQLQQFYLEQKSLVTLTGVNPPSRFGELELEGNTVKSFFEKPQLSSGMINGGYFVIGREIFDHLTPDESCDLEFGPFLEIAEQGKMSCFKHDGFWQCMDTLREKNYLEKLWKEERAPWKIWD